MIDTKELRRLAQVAIAKMSASDPEFASSVTPLAVLELLDRLEAAEEDRSNFIVEMGKLCAQCDALRLRIEAAEKECDNANAAAVGVALEAERLQGESDTYKAAYNGWTDKTEWVQQGFNEGTISAKYLGMHRADVMARLLDEAAKERQIDEGRIANLMADLNRVGHENDAMRAKVERMERQGPVEWQTRTRPAWNDGTWGPWRKCSEEYAEDIKKTPLLHDWLYEARALYALPGAKGE